VTAEVATKLVMEALAKRYPAPEYAFFTEIRDHTGFARATPHTADALAMGLWPSRGLELLGFEVKASRPDWLRELKDPGKAEAICRFCDRWWIVTGTPDIVQAGELPPTWGLLVLTARGLKTTVEAPKLDPQPIDRPMLASLMRRVHQRTVPDRYLREAEKKGYERGRQAAQGDAKTWEREAKDRQALIDEFERQSGVQIRSWNRGQIGDAVKAVMTGTPDRARRQLETTRSTLAHLYDAVERELKAFQEAGS
jgi:hypothetical protein